MTRLNFVRMYLELLLAGLTVVLVTIPALGGAWMLIVTPGVETLFVAGVCETTGPEGCIVKPV